VLPELKIGNLKAKLPIIQGGMAVRISTAPLAAAVANEGGIGVIAATGMSIGELRKEIKKARELSKGIIGVNVLFAVKEFANLIKTAMEEGIDLVISGAGISRDMYSWGKNFNVPIVPIVSSIKLATLAEKMGAAAIVVEGTEAGGHLGTDCSMREILPQVRKAVSVPVIGAGGVFTGRDILEVLSLGANGVQMGTRFAAAQESNASQAFKELYVNAEEKDITTIHSPVGLPGRAIRNSYVKKINASGDQPKVCAKCLKQCSHSFCLLKALNNAQRGFLEEGLVFAGQCVAKVKEIKSVKEIFNDIFAEIEAVAATTMQGG
jgi:nitronate monooxygenase